MHAQLINKLKDKVKQKTDQVVEPKEQPAEAAGNSAKTVSEAPAVQPTSSESFASFSKYDFVTGEKIIALEDFSKAEIGDFPAKWLTDGSAEVVTLSNLPGRWLKYETKGALLPSFIGALPENFTFECDIACSPGFNINSSTLYITFAAMSNPSNDYTAWNTNNGRGTSDAGVRFLIQPASFSNEEKGNLSYMVVNNYSVLSQNKNETPRFFSNNPKKTMVHLAFWRQKERIRMYVNQDKVFDISKAFAGSYTYNGISFYNDGRTTDQYFISNLKLAVGAPDTRNKLLTEGKWISRGILFDVNSDHIKPDSYGSLKQIADILKENADVKITIVGHTDSDGDAAKNLELSKKRAAAVKKALVDQFEIDAARMETDGKGATEPVDKNDNPEGKANNRRVEFIKK